jgi:hypothetical protein
MTKISSASLHCRRSLPALLAAALALGIAAAPARTAGRQRGSHVTVDRDLALVIDGKKVFPIGFTMPPPPDGKTPEGKNGIEELHDAGATFLRTGSGGPWDEAALAQETAWEDAAARFGMHCWVYLGDLASIAPGEREKEALLRRVVGRFARHPGMGVWKGVDEPEWGKRPVPPLLRAREIIREVDPDHPLALTQAPRGTVATLRPYTAAADITGADIYPVSYPPGIHSLLPNKEISMVGDYTKTMKVVAGERLPVWMILQIAFSGVVKAGKTLRLPTFPQERFMTYQAIINGARGLIYFGGNLKAACTPEDAALGWNWRFWKRVLRPIVEEIGDRSPLYPALVAPESKLQVTASMSGTTDDGRQTDDGGRQIAGAPSAVRRPSSAVSNPQSGLEFCLREVGDDLFLLACKRGGETVEVEFSGLPSAAAEGEVLFESPRKVEAKDGRFKDWFGPFEVHVYRFQGALARK